MRVSYRVIIIAVIAQNHIGIKRVAAYIRVSTSLKEQAGSYKAQFETYSKIISQHMSWELIGIYGDNGKTGTNIKCRPSFNRMLDDARAGKIDLIIVKSVSRFSRNTLDLLTTIRQLKAIGVEVYFEEQNLFSSDSKCEAMLTIMVSIAQEESHNLSDNIKWGIRRKMEKGEFTLPYKRFLGYKKGANGRPAIVRREARVVCKIYNLYLAGVPINRIATILTKKNIPTPGGGKKWYPKTIQSILTNEKYVGEALLQKTYVEDYLTHKSVPNNRVLRQYKVENSHPAIIDKETFEKVQKKIRCTNTLPKDGS